MLSYQLLTNHIFRWYVRLTYLFGLVLISSLLVMQIVCLFPLFSRSNAHRRFANRLESISVPLPFRSIVDCRLAGYLGSTLLSLSFY